MAREEARTAAVFTVAVDQATAGYQLPIDQLVPAAGRAGFPLLEVPAFALAQYRSRHGHTELVRLLDRHRLRVGQLSCGSGTPADLTVPPDRWPDALEAWERSCRLATAVGCPRLSVFVPRTATARASVVAARLGELAAMAGDHGLRVNAELHAPPILEEAARIWQGTDAANAGLLVDVAALALAGLDPVEHIACLPRGAVGWVHVADLTEPASGTGRSARVLPGQGRLPLADALDALAAGGYTGPVAAEVPRAEPYTADTAAHLTRAAAALTSGVLARFFAPGGDR
ncbi:sugar phosphate isomerase/epimerase family protein [Streptomyces sp. Inha503]|uniref:sugar phosphate isomerase/epimerase family protein n=1 Tax=Streptomyces sp. Inha503 TaxID=3383314 RepID=UPI0039A0B36C